METRKVLSSLCYFSVFFAGFIFPLAVFFATSDEVTKQHAKKSLLSHLIPLITVPLLIFSVGYEFVSIQNEIPVFTIGTVILMILVSVIVVIWNIIKGVKVLVSE